MTDKATKAKFQKLATLWQQADRNGHTELATRYMNRYVRMVAENGGVDPLL